MRNDKRAYLTALAVASLTASSGTAAAFTEGFDDITNLPGWFMQNNSQPLGITNWFQGNPNVFPAHSGATNSYIAANYLNGDLVATISNWLVTPQVTLQNGDVLSFFARSIDSVYPDRLQVRMSTAGASTNVGNTATSVGDFTILLLDINPNYQQGVFQNVWTQYTVTVSGLGGPTSGRFAFRYFAENAGPFGANSDYIGIDTVAYTPVPEPATMLALGVGLVALAARRRRK